MRSVGDRTVLVAVATTTIPSAHSLHNITLHYYTAPSSPLFLFVYLLDLFVMATNGTPQAFAPGEVLQAMQTMRGSDTDKKKKAHEYLESFQKSVGFPLPLSRVVQIYGCEEFHWPRGINQLSFYIANITWLIMPLSRPRHGPSVSKYCSRKPKPTRSFLLRRP